jgi:hypothetical protein
VGQAKRKREAGGAKLGKRSRFVQLMRLISGYKDRDIKRFAEIRGLR